MAAFIIGSSALYFWRHEPNPYQFFSPRISPQLNLFSQSPDDLHKLNLDETRFGPNTIHLMAPSADLRISRRSFKYSVWSAPLPKTSFCQIDEGIYVASPEFCILQAANAYPFARLLELSMELCGTYVLNRAARRGFDTRDQQLTSIAHVKDFIATMPRAKQAKQVVFVMKLIENGSHSPMETREYLLLCLPKRLGGYGIPRPMLNAVIELNNTEQHLAQRGHFTCDMYWPEKQLVIEYDGHNDHESREDRHRDAVKRNILTDKGYTVFTLTGKQICNTMSFDAFARNLAKTLGFRLKGFPQNWEEKRSDLRAEIFASLSTYEADRFF